MSTADSATLKVPASSVRPSWRLQGVRVGSGPGLAPATAFVNTNVLYQVIPILGAQKLTVRIKTATGGGTIDIIFVGPDFPFAQAAAFASLVGTQYTSGNPTQVAVTAGTEALITTPCDGENYAIVKFTATATGTITYVDIAQLALSVNNGRGG